MSWLKIAVVLVAVAAAAVFIRYGSARPCEWLVHDIAAKSGLPKLAVQALLLAQSEATEPGAGRCLARWVDLHVNGVDRQLEGR